MSIALLTVFAQPYTNNLLLEFDFRGNYTATGVTFGSSTGINVPIVTSSEGNSTLAVDDANSRMYWRIGDNGRTWFFHNITYAILDAVDPNTCFIVRRNGTLLTYFDEVNGYKTARQSQPVVTSDDIKLRLKNSPFWIPLPGSINNHYGGLVDDAQRCEFPYTVSIFKNIRYNFVQRVLLNQIIRLPSTIPNLPYIEVNAYSDTIYNRVDLNAPNPEYFKIPSICNNAQDWCSVYGKND